MAENEMITQFGDTDLEQYAPIKEVKSVLQTGANSKKNDINLTKMAYLFMQGYNDTQIAEALGVAPRTIRDYRASEEFKALVNSISAEIISTARTFLASASMKAVKTIVTLMNSPNDRIKLTASTEILDRVGLKSPDKLEILAKGDNIQSMSEEELMNVVKLGMTEILPLVEKDKK